MTTSVQRRCATNSLLTNTIAGAFINEAHAELLESYEWSRKKSEIIILTTAQKTAGTVAVTNGSGAVTGTGTAFSAADVGKYVRIGTDNAIYVVLTRTSATAITLGDFNGTAVNYAGSTSTSTAYVIFQRWYTLGSAIESVDVARYKDKLGEITTDALDRGDPTRSTTGDPTLYSLGPRDSNDYPQVELWPRPTGTIAVNFNVIKGHTDLSGTNNPIVPSVVVVWKAAMLSCYFLHSKDEDERWLKLAGAYEKEFDRAWERVKTMDESKFGLPKYIRDIGGPQRAATDFGVDHDVR